MSAFWILSANSWMQTPAGYTIEDGIAYPADWLAIIFNPSFPYRLAHMLNASFLTGGFVVLAVGARYLLAGRHVEEARTMLRMAIGADRGAGAAAASSSATMHGRQHAQIPADQDRRDGSALGRQQAGAVRDFRLAGREDRKQSLRDLDPACRVAHRDAAMERPVPGTERRAAAGPAAAAERVLRLPHHARHRSAT